MKENIEITKKREIEEANIDNKVDKGYEILKLKLLLANNNYINYEYSYNASLGRIITIP